MKNSNPQDVSPLNDLVNQLGAYISSSWRRWMRGGWRGVKVLLVLLVVAAGAFYWVKRNAPQVNPALFDFTRTYTLLTGQTSKEYHRVGGTLANALNDRAAELGLRLVIRPTRGTSHNMDLLIAGEADLGFVQAQQYFPGPGLDQDAKKIRRETKVLGQLYTSSCTLLVGAKSTIRRLEDLQGKRVGVLSFSTSDRLALIDLLTAADVTYWIPPEERKGGLGAHGGEAAGPDDVTIQLFSLAKLSKRLKLQELDAFFLTSPHPSPLVRRYLVGNGMRFASIISNFERLRLQSSAYFETTIAVEVYASSASSEDIPTIGSKTLLVASNALPDDVAYGITKALYEAVDTLKTKPVAQDMSGPTLVDGIPLESLHPGAVRFYQERRLLTRAHRLPPHREAEPPQFLVPKSAAVSQLVLGLDDPISAADQGLVSLVEASSVDAVSQRINSLVTGRYALALLPDAEARREPLTRAENLERLSTRSIRSVCRVPGDIAQLAVAEELQATSLRDLGGLRIGVAQDDPRAIPLLDWIDRQLMSMHAALLVRVPKPLSLLAGAYLAREVDGLLVLDSAPSALLTEVLHGPLQDPARPIRFIGLEHKDGGDPGPEGFVSTVLPAALYPDIQTEPISTWLEPLTLLSSTRLSPLTIKHVLTRLIPRIHALPASRGWDASALLSGLTFPLHEGVILAKESILKAESAPEAFVPTPAASLTEQAEAGTAGQGIPADPANTPSTPVETMQPSPLPMKGRPSGAMSSGQEYEFPDIPLEPELESPLILTASDPDSPVFETASAVSEVLASFCRPDLEGVAHCRRGAQVALLGTSGAEESLRALLEDRAQYALLHADLLHDALNKRPPWNEYTTSKIRSIATLYVSALSVLAARRELMGGHVTGGGALKPGEQRMTPQDVSTIGALSDLEGRRVSLRHTAEPLARSNAITLFNRETFFDSLWKLSLVPQEPPPLSSARLFMDGTILALFFMSPHPVTWVEMLMKRNRDSLMLPVTGLERYLEGNPQLSRALIDVSVYDDEQQGRRLIPTIGIPVILVTTTSAPDWQVEMLLSTLVAEAPLFAKRYPILNHLTLEFMQSCANIEPHIAAESFYKKAASGEPKR